MSSPEQILPGAVEALVIRPGDTLILRFGADVTPAQFAAFKENALAELKQQMPGVEFLFIGGCEQMSVYRPDPTEDG